MVRYKPVGTYGTSKYQYRRYVGTKRRCQHNKPALRAIGVLTRFFSRNLELAHVLLRLERSSARHSARGVMGKKKRPAGPAQIPLFYAKKRKLNEATQLTALVALHKYCAKFKLGAPGFRPLTTAPHHEVCVVMDGAELGRARHADRAGAMERAALLTLNLLDPEAKRHRNCFHQSIPFAKVTPFG